MLLTGQEHEDRLPRRFPGEGQLGVELEAVELRQPLALEAALLGEVEEHQGVGGEGLGPPPLAAREQD